MFLSCSLDVSGLYLFYAQMNVIIYPTVTNVAEVKENGFQIHD